jgi:hypothetical protein
MMKDFTDALAGVCNFFLYLIMAAGVVLLNLAWIALVVWVIVKVVKLAL